MSEYKVGWISDSHLGYQQYGNRAREKDFFLGLKSAVEVLVNKTKVDTIIHTGDLFHSAKLSSGTWDEFLQVHKFLKEAKIDCWTLEGNHDQTLGIDAGMPHPWIPFNRNVVGGFKLLSNFDVEEDRATGLRICGGSPLPIDKLKAKLPTLGRTDLLLLHVLVKEFIEFDLPGALSLEDLPAHVAQFICLGDVHIRKFLTLPRAKNIEVGYPGSTELVSSAEEEDKTAEVLIFDQKTRFLLRHHNVPFPTRPVFRKTVQTVEELGKVLAELVLWKPFVSENRKTPSDPRYPLLYLQHAPEIPGVRETVFSVLDSSKWIIRLSIVGTVDDATLGNVVPEATMNRIQLQSILPEVLAIEDPLFPVLSMLVDPTLEMENCADRLEEYVQQRLGVTNV